jgi:ferrochelatase
MAQPIGIVLLNLGGPDSPEAVEPFLRNLFADPEVIQLGWLRFLQPMLARMIAKRRAPLSRAAYAQIGGRSPIRDESEAQARAVAEAVTRQGLAARPYVAMACWHPFSDEAVAAMRADGVSRAVAVPLFPHHSRTTTGSSFQALDRAAEGKGLEIARVDSYPDAPGYVQAVCDCLRDALNTLPPELRADAPVLLSAHGLPEAYIRKGDRYLDEIRVTYGAVTRALAIEGRAQLCFQSRLGPQKWLGPYTEEAIDRVAQAGHKAVVVCPIAFTGEHIETLQELDILYRDRARGKGIEHFARARTVGVHPAFIDALAKLAVEAARQQGWG